ncbi:hypothetical protein BU26DRAFT_186255 [Trematosphaeria pertusa]|uniref:Uncharacterized protein n=1 Tax=Trematosphaeria pertusa TaxID=390896 RepID=A0A6A6HS73_9PLEO|nr:uncharacterized protein BU26DRAFT_186255 [Trematosphaeria pertusa]KAF2241024.1 hypothetical protein BU26DRAFT_186255 [Trematosphaeria pertusa]
MLRPHPPIQPSLLLRLPREIRDIIYSSCLNFPQPIPLLNPQAPALIPHLFPHPTLAAEALEALYKTSTFILSLRLYPSLNLLNRWGPYPHLTQHIRHLIVDCIEGSSSIPDFATYEETYGASSIERRLWTSLLALPRLESLAVNMQKAHDGCLFTLDFAPVLFHLRALRPGLSIRFSISFDEMLQRAWDDPYWQTFHASSVRCYSAPYQKMGYADVSCLVAPPSEEDRRYVQMYLGDRKMPRGRSARQGLLDEGPAQRRALAGCYAVRDPPLLRVLMAEHYEVYMRCAEARKTGREGLVEQLGR